jgi:hypothetical protein
MRRISLILLLFMISTQGLAAADSGGSPASANASGEGVMVTGSDPYNFESTKPMNGTISIRVNNKGDRGSPLQNIDDLTVKAEFLIEKINYKVIISEPMINHINGRDPTWFGVVYNQPMHGDTKIGTSSLPKMEPAIALWGWAEVYKNGELIQSRVPAHVKVMEKMPLKGVTLQVGVEGQPLANTPDGYLHIHWPDVDQLVLPVKQQKMREGLGWGGLLLLNFWFGWLAIKEPVLENGRRRK